MPGKVPGFQSPPAARHGTPESFGKKMSAIRYLVLWIAITAVSFAKAESEVQLLRDMLPRIYDTDFAYLKAPLGSKAQHLDECERILAEFETKESKGLLRGEIFNLRCLLLQRRVKVAFAQGDKSAVARYAADYERIFVEHGMKLGPKWYEDGKIRISMIVEWADMEDERELRDFARGGRQ